MTGVARNTVSKLLVDIERQDTPEAQFAVEIATMQFVAVEESPLNGQSLTSLLSKGAGYTIGGWDAFTGHPFFLGVLVIGQFGVVIGQVMRAFGDGDDAPR